MEGKGGGGSGRLRGETRGKGGFWSGLGGVRGGELATELLWAPGRKKTRLHGLGQMGHRPGQQVGLFCFVFLLFLYVKFVLL